MKSFYTFRKALIIDSQTRKIELPYNICYALRQLNQLYKLIDLVKFIWMLMITI